ncbi:MAG: Npun_F5749 family FMN-dependent PPOX-type flavoprotein [Synechocystis sp.]|nr:Npun_F5749 family FMN-dependent PPOX-type flavoprotein [Synechocystis sp.]
MSLAPWRSPLAHALHRSRRYPEARYFQLATVDAEGFPHNRTVVFRGFTHESNGIKIITDRRSAKIPHLHYQPRAAICWYFSKTREQWRFQGTIQLITDAETDTARSQDRQQIWQSLSDNARVQFAWPSPASLRPDVEQAIDVDFPDPITPLPTFYVLYFHPHQVDHLELRGNPQNLTRYCLAADQCWDIQHLFP